MTLHKSDVRELTQLSSGSPTTDGAGVQLRRLIGTPALPTVDPFLMLDFFGSNEPLDYIAGFPNHPHRGFETVTYMLKGRMRHEDSLGNGGVIGPGDVQWMTAGRGLIHSEMPEQEEGLLQGFQLWVNLPAAKKMMEPKYRGFQSKDLPIEESEGTRVKVIAGETDRGLRGPIEIDTVSPIFFDIELKASVSFVQSVPAELSGFLFVIGGAVRVGDVGTELREGTIGVLGEGEIVKLRAAEGGAQLLLVAGRPLNEPVVRHGPFVMNTQTQIRQAIRDYQQGVF